MVAEDIKHYKVTTVNGQTIYHGNNAFKATQYLYRDTGNQIKYAGKIQKAVQSVTVGIQERLN